MSEQTSNTESQPITPENVRVGLPVSGKVTRLVLAGAMVDIGLPNEALLHLSQVGKSDLRNIEEAFQVGDKVDAFVYRVDAQHQRIALTTIKPPAVSWRDVEVGNVYQGKVVRIEKFGAFVDIGAERPGMVHVSEMGDDYVQSPEDVVRVGDIIEVRVLKYNAKKRQIDLTMKTPREEMRLEFEEDQQSIPTAMELALRRAQASNRRSGNERANRKQSRYDDERDDIIRRTLRNQYK